MRLRPLALSTTILLALGGCTQFNEARNQEKAYEDRAQSTHIPTRELITASDHPYLIGDPVKPTTVIPPALREPITVSWSRPLSLREAATQLSIRTGIPIRVRPDADDTAIAADTPQQSALSGMSAPSFNGTSLPAPPLSSPRPHSPLRMCACTMQPIRQAIPAGAPGSNIPARVTACLQPSPRVSG